MKSMLLISKQNNLRAGVRGRSNTTEHGCIYEANRADEERKEEIEKYGMQREIDESVIDTIMSTANVQLKGDKEGERKMSCSLLDRVKEAGREEGVLSDVKNLMETLHLSAEQAMDALKISEEEKQKYYSKLPGTHIK